MECDDFSECHDMKTMGEDDNALRVFCRICKHMYVIRKDHNANPEKRTYAKLFKRDIIQPSQNLYYKYYAKANIA